MSALLRRAGAIALEAVDLFCDWAVKTLILAGAAIILWEAVQLWA